MQPPMTDKANITTNLGSNITCLCYSSNDVLAVATAKLTGNVWNGSFFTLGDSGQINHRIEMEHGCSAIAWCGKEDSLLLVSSDDGVTRLWALQERYQMKQAFDGHDDLITSVVVNPTEQSKFATSSYDTTIKIWNSDSKSVMAEGRLTGHDDYVTCLAWSPKAPLTLVSGSWDCTLRFWDLRAKENTSHTVTPAKVLTLGWASEFIIYYGTVHGSVTCLDTRTTKEPLATTQIQNDLAVRSLQVNPHNNEQIAVAGDNSLVSVHGKLLEKLYGYEGHSDYVSAVAWSRKKQGILASGGFDKCVHLWNKP